MPGARPVTVTYNRQPQAPVNGGTYAVVASFAVNAEYRPASDTTKTITITRVTPVVDVVSMSVVYDGNPPAPSRAT